MSNALIYIVGEREKELQSIKNKTCKKPTSKRFYAIIYTEELHTKRKLSETYKQSLN